MFEKKKLWMVLATAAFVAACGGGGGGGGDTSGGGNQGPGNDPDPITSDDTALNGYLLLANNHMLFNGYQDIGAFEGSGIYGQAKGPNGAPLNAVGFRIRDAVEGDEATPDDEAIGRLGITLTEQAGTVGTESAEAMRIIVNGVRMTTNASNVVSANVVDGATMIVSGTTASGAAVGPVEVAIPSTSVRVAPSTDYAGGDEFSSVLVFDMAQAFGAMSTAQADALGDLTALEGRFDMNITLSAAQIRGGAGGDADVLEGAEITVSGDAPINGSGATGNICIGVTDPCE